MKRDEIIEHLKSRILSGEIPAGSFLPHRAELLEYCGASNVTVQRAVNHLVEAGFLCSCGSRGIMVSKTPPHRFRFGILIPSGSRPEEKDYDSRWSSILAAMNEIEEHHKGYRFVRYWIGRETRPTADEYCRLLSDLRNSLLAGVIVPRSLPPELLKPLDGFPVVMHEPLDRHLIRAVSLGHDFSVMTAMAIEELKRHGVRKLAVIMGAEQNPIAVAEIEKLLAASGLETRREWVHGVSHTSRGAAWTERIIRLLFMPGAPEVPDGLIVLNENLLPYVVETLGAIGRIVGRDVRVCSHCNLPAGRIPLDKVDYVAFDACTVLNRSIWYLHHFQQLEKEVFEHEVLIPPVAVQSRRTPAARHDAREIRKMLRLQ